MFKITNEWLMQHRTKNGGWTKEQFDIIDLKWPPNGGWKTTCLGGVIQEKTKLAFEQAATKTIDKQVREVLTVEICFQFLLNNFTKVSDEQMIDLNNKWIEID